MAILALILFVSIFLLVLYGYPVAFTLGGLSLMYAVCFLDPSFFNVLPPRFLGVLSNYVLLAVPLFVFMGLILEKSGIAQTMLVTMGQLLSGVPGGLALSVLLVGTLLAASTGIVGATVVTMGLISLPTMLDRGYSPSLACGVVAASGTLGQIIPPSIVLILLGSVMNVSIGQLFSAALLPGVLLVVCYAVYIVFSIWRMPLDLRPKTGAAAFRELKESSDLGKRLVVAFVLPLLLIAAVLGSIFMGIASPTEAAAVGAFGAAVLTATQGKLSWAVLKKSAQQTSRITAMVFMILLGATTFASVFRALEGDRFLIDLLQAAELSGAQFLIVVLIVVFVAGFFIDFIEIIFIVVPIVMPIFEVYEMDLIWVGILLALNLQTSFLTPPFGFSLFYLKGVAPDSISTQQIYAGAYPFVGIQLMLILAVAFVPQLFGF